MRTLSAALTAAQKKPQRLLCKIVLTKTGQTTRTYGVNTANRIKYLRHTEGAWDQVAEIIIDNAKTTLTGLDLTGYTGTISHGFNTTSDEYSACAPLKVIAQRDDSAMGRVDLALSLAGSGNQMAEDKAQADYFPLSTDTSTIKTLITAVFGATLAPFSHCEAFTVTYDSEDALIDVFIPADKFIVRVGDSRKSKVEWLLIKTKCVGRWEDDGEFHIRKAPNANAPTWANNTAYAVNDTIKPTTDNNHIYVCTTAGTSGGTEPTWGTTVGGTTNDGTAVWTLTYDYQYTLVYGDHFFYSKSHRKQLVIPNFITVQSDPSHATQYSGTATDADSYAKLPIKSEPFYMRLTSDAQADLIAQAMIAKLQMAAQRGSAYVPMNVGQEVFDLVKFTDRRQNDYRIGNVLSLTRFYDSGRPPPDKFSMVVSLGDLVSVPMGILPPAMADVSATGTGSLTPDYRGAITQLIQAINTIYRILANLANDIKTLFSLIGNIQTVLADHERRITALEAGTNPPNITATNSGYMYYLGSGVESYATVHNAANAQFVNDNDVSYVGQAQEIANNFDIYRGGLEFSLASESSGGTLVGVTIWLWGLDYGLDGPFNVTVVSGTDLANPLALADYGDLLNDTTSWGILASADYIHEGWNKITLNATGIAAVQAALGSTIRFGLRSSRDISSTSPVSGQEFVAFYGSSSSSGLKPRIVLTYGD